jgi:hypothetical protein
MKNGGCDKEKFEKKYSLSEIESILKSVDSVKTKYELSKFNRLLPYEKQKAYQGLDNYSTSYQKIANLPNDNVSIARHTFQNSPQCLQDNVKPLNLSDQQLGEIKNALKNFSKNELMSKVAKFSCAQSDLKKINGTTPKLVEFNDGAFEAIQNKNVRDIQSIMKRMNSPKNRVPKVKDFMHQHLSKGLPVAISYCLGTVIDKRLLEKNEQCAGMHASLVIGRKYDQKRKSCMLLVRNSWGNIPKIIPSYDYGVVEKDDQEGSNFWISEDKLYSDFPKAFSATAFE